MRNKGFTLVELIIVIAILAVIMLIGVPAFATIQERMAVRSDIASAGQIGKALTVRETDIGETSPLPQYPTITRYDEISGVEAYAAKDFRPQSMKDGYFFVTAIQTSLGKRILVGIGRKNLPITNTAYTSKDNSGWAWSEGEEITKFLATNGTSLNETVTMPDGYPGSEGSGESTGTLLASVVM